MTDESPAAPAAYQGLDPRTVRALAALLSIDPAAAAQARERSPARRRPDPQYGPQLALGDETDGQSPAAVDGSGADGC